MNKSIINKIVLPSVYILSWVLMYFFPRRMFHIGGDNGIEGWILYIMAFLGLPYLLYYTLKRNRVYGDKLKSIAYGSVFLIVPFILYIDKEDNEELERYRQETVGIVNKAWMWNHRGTKTWSIQARYIVNGKEYQTSTKDDFHRILNYGDTITIIYSLKTPEMSEIKELMEK